MVDTYDRRPAHRGPDPIDLDHVQDRRKQPTDEEVMEANKRVLERHGDTLKKL